MICGGFLSSSESEFQPWAVSDAPHSRICSPNAATAKGDVDTDPVVVQLGFRLSLMCVYSGLLSKHNSC